MLARTYITIDDQNLRERLLPLSAFPIELQPYAINFCYKSNEYAYHGPYLAEVLQDHELVVQLQNFLKDVHPQGLNSQIPFKGIIECKDILHPNSIPGIELCFDDAKQKWDLPEKVAPCFYNMRNMTHSREEILNPFGYTLIQNDKFLLVIRNDSDNDNLYIYKKF